MESIFPTTFSAGDNGVVRTKDGEPAILDHSEIMPAILPILSHLEEDPSDPTNFAHVELSALSTSDIVRLACAAEDFAHDTGSPHAQIAGVAVLLASVMVLSERIPNEVAQTP
jgi:hypothetical protein